MNALINTVVDTHVYRKIYHLILTQKNNSAFIMIVKLLNY